RTCALLVRSPLAEGLTVPPIVKVSAWPTPAARLPPVNDTVLPDEPLEPHVAVPVGAHATVTPVMLAGTTSLKFNDGAFEGPALVIVTVYAVGVPAMSPACPSLLLIVRSATPAPWLLVSVAALFDAFESVDPAPAVTVAVFTSVPVAPELTVPVTVSVNA